MKYSMRNYLVHMKTKKAFTLVETLVAIAILLVAIVGPFYAVSRSINASYVARDQLTASALAQEGTEYIYNLRDNNYFTGNGWLDGINGTPDASGHVANCISPNKCVVDIPRNTITACSETCSTLYLDTYGLYTQDGSKGPATGYTRSVEVMQVSASEVRVVVTVSWKTLGKTYTAVVNDELYNWL